MPISRNLPARRAAEQRAQALGLLKLLREGRARKVFTFHSRNRRARAFASLLEHTGMFDSNQISLFGAKMAYKWSRIRTLHDYSDDSDG